MFSQTKLSFFGMLLKLLSFLTLYYALKYDFSHREFSSEYNVKYYTYIGIYIIHILFIILCHYIW